MYGEKWGREYFIADKRVIAFDGVDKIARYASHWFFDFRIRVRFSVSR